MKRIIILFLLFSACKKNKDFDFPRGKWEAYAFQLVSPPEFNDQEECLFTYFYGVLSIEYTGGNKIHYGSDKGTETFNIKKVSKKNEANKTIYTLKLRNKKGKLFVFEYKSELKNIYDYSNNTWVEDTVLIGDYWRKGQNYYTYECPNNVIGECIKQNSTSSFGRYDKVAAFRKN